MGDESPDEDMEPRLLAVSRAGTASKTERGRRTVGEDGGRWGCLAGDRRGQTSVRRRIR